MSYLKIFLFTLFSSWGPNTAYGQDIPEHCQEVTFSLTSHIPTVTDCTVMHTLTVAWNDLSSLNMAFDNITEVQGDLYIFALFKVTSVSFPQLKRIGGTLKIGSLQSHVEIENVIFPNLTSVGGQVMVGDRDSHFGKIGTVHFAAVDGLRVDKGINIGGAQESTVDFVHFDRLLQVGQNLDDGSSTTAKMFAVQSAGVVNEVHVNAQFDKRELDIFGTVAVALLGRASFIRLVIIGSVRTLGGGVEYSGGTNLGPILLNGLPVRLSQAPGVCSGNGVLTAQLMCECWTHHGPDCAFPGDEPFVTTQPALTSEPPSDDLLSSTPNGTAIDESDANPTNQKLFGVVPLWALLAGAGGLTLIIILIIIRLKCRSRSINRKSLQLVTGIKEFTDEAKYSKDPRNKVELQWDDEVREPKQKLPGDSDISRDTRSSSFFKKTRKQDSSSGLMPEAGSVSFDAPPTPSFERGVQGSSFHRGGMQSFRAPHIPSSQDGRMRSQSFSQQQPPRRGNTRGVSISKPPSLPGLPEVPPRPSLSMKLPSNTVKTTAAIREQSVRKALAESARRRSLSDAETDRRRSSSETDTDGDGADSINLTLFNVSPAVRNPQPQPSRKARSRRSSKSSHMRRPAMMAKRKVSLEDVEESDCEDLADALMIQESIRRRSSMSMGGEDTYHNHSSLGLGNSHKLSLHPQFDDDDEDGTYASSADLDMHFHSTDFQQGAHGTTYEVDVETDLDDDNSDVDITKEINLVSKMYGSSSIRQGVMRPPPIPLGRHPSLRNAPEGLRNAAIEQERRKSRQMDEIYSTTALTRGGSGALLMPPPDSEDEIDDTYEVPVMTRSPRTGRMVIPPATAPTAPTRKPTVQQRNPPAPVPSQRRRRSSGSNTMQLSRTIELQSVMEDADIDVDASQTDDLEEDDEENPYLLPVGGTEDTKPSRKSGVMQIGGFDNSCTESDDKMSSYTKSLNFGDDSRFAFASPTRDGESGAEYMDVQL